jgi:hypothetical protein
MENQISSIIDLLAARLQALSSKETAPPRVEAPREVNGYEALDRMLFQRFERHRILGVPSFDLRGGR